MNTKLKSRAHSVLSVVLSVCMLISCITVGLISTDAAQDNSENVGGHNVNWQGKVYFRAPDTWDIDTYSKIQIDITRTQNAAESNYQYFAVTMSRIGTSRMFFATINADHSNWNQNEYICFTANDHAYSSGTFALNSNQYYTKPENYSFTDSGQFYYVYPSNSTSCCTTSNGNEVSVSNNSQNSLIKFNQTMTAQITTDNGATGTNSAEGGIIRRTAYYVANDTTFNQSSDATTASNPSATYNNAADGALVTLTAVPNQGYELAGWYDSYLGELISPNGNTYSYYSRGTRTVYARFKSSVDLDGYTKLYVLDGIDTDGSFGTNSFGDSVIISAAAGLAHDDNDSLVSYDAGHGEGGLIYYYDPTVDLDFRVQTTIASGNQALGVRAFVMNGITYPAKKSDTGVYYADITLEANSDQGVLEVIPVYYNTLIEEAGDYIKFYVDANTIGDKFGKTIGYSVWYKNTSDHGETGGYPGQPLLSDGTLLYGYFPKYYVSNNATSLPDENSRSAFSGVLLSNLAEHNDTHKDVLTDWGCDTNNYQSFDYLDPVKIASLENVDTIEFVAKYKELATTHRYDGSYNSRNLNGVTGKNWPVTVARPSSAADALDKGFEYLTDIDGKQVNIFNDSTNNLTGEPLYVVSVGNQIVSPNNWDTVWEVYTASGTSIAAARPVDFINPSSTLQNALSNYTNSPVLINYEGWLAGENNSGTRLDGRWLYSQSTDPTTLRIRVATENNGVLTFMEDGIAWADINDGVKNGQLEAADLSNLTKILNLENRTTEVTAKINPVGYTVEGMYLLGSSYSGTSDNGYSTDLSDYNNMNVSGTATSFVNAKDNRMVIVVKQIPDTDLVITHQMYGGPGAHKIKGFYYVKAELLDSNDVVVKAYNDGEFTNKALTIESFTTDAPKNGGYKLKVTIRTVMSGSASFNQWYENDHNNGYDEIDSTDAHGSTEPVEKEIIIDVDDLYGETSLEIKNLDYYSDLQAAGSVYINHLLLPATVEAGLDGTTYTQVTVVNASGTAVQEGAYSPRIKTTEVGSEFITTDNAENGYKLKVEIWTVPASPAEFDKFFKDTSNEMTSTTENGIEYTINQTISFNGNTYPSATVLIPISYFFNTVYDEDLDENVLEFDSSKQNFYVYSSLKTGYKYILHFDFLGYRNLYGELGYDYPLTEFTAGELNDYFVLSDSVKDSNNNTVTAYTFKDDDARTAFINQKAPYENTFMEIVHWQTGMYDAGANPNGMTATFDSATNTWEYFVKLEKSNDRYTFATFRFPYAVGDYNSKHAPLGTVVNKLTNEADYIEVGGRSSTDISYRTEYGKNYTIGGSFVTAPEKVLNGGQWEYFDYWKVENVGNDKTGSAEYTRCYYPEFNLSLYQDSIITPVFDADSEGTTPHERALRDDNARNDPYNTDGRATITLMENSRMQWTTGRDGNNLPDTYANGGDRIYTDFLISYTYNDLQLRTDTTGMKAGIVIETVRDLDMVDGNYVTKDQIDYKNSDDSSVDKSAVEAYIKNGTGSKFLKSEFNVTKLDDKNRMNYYYSLPNISQSTHQPTERKNKLYRAYSYLKDSDSNVLLISDPIYFTIYDIASIENMADGENYGGVS